MDTIKRFGFDTMTDEDSPEEYYFFRHFVHYDLDVYGYDWGDRLNAVFYHHDDRIGSIFVREDKIEEFLISMGNEPDVEALVERYNSITVL